MKAFVSSIQYSNGEDAMKVLFTQTDGVTHKAVALPISMNGVQDPSTLTERAVAEIIAYSDEKGLGMDRPDIFLPVYENPPL